MSDIVKICSNPDCEFGDLVTLKNPMTNCPMCKTLLEEHDLDQEDVDIDEELENNDDDYDDEDDLDSAFPDILDTDVD